MVAKEQRRNATIDKYGGRASVGGQMAGNLLDNRNRLQQQQQLWDKGKMPKLVAEQRKQEKQQQQLDKRAQKESTKQGYQAMFGKTIGAGLSYVAPVVMGIATAIAAATAAAVALSKTFVHLSQPIEEAARRARELGTGLEGLTALEHVASAMGVATEDLSGAMESLQGVLQSSDAEANRVLGRIGLDVKQLRNLPVDEATARIADALRTITDPAERARIAIGLFGTKAVGLGPLLDRGGDAIRKIAAEARRTGVAFDEVQAEKVRAANEALTRLSATFTGLMNTVIINIAPWLEWSATMLMAVADGSAFTYLGEQVTSFTTFSLATLQGWADSAGETVMGWAYQVADVAMPYVTSAMETLQPYTDQIGEWFWAAYDQVASAVELMANAFVDGLGWALETVGIDSQAAFKTMNDGITSMIAHLTKAYEWVKGLWDFIAEKTGLASTDEAKLVPDPGAMEGAGQTAGEAIGRGINRGVEKMSGGGGPLNKVRAKVLEDANALEAELGRIGKEIGLSGPLAKINDLERKGLGKDQADGLRQMAESARLVEAGWSQVQEFDPSQQFDRQLEGLKKLRAEGRITEDQYLRGVNKSQKDLIAAAGVGEIKTVGGAAAGSQAAVSAITRSNLQQKVNNDPVQEMRRAQKELAEIQRAQLDVAKKTLAALERPEEEELF
jgi:hypothetical protein